jgi:hypothetical protein
MDTILPDAMHARDFVGLPVVSRIPGHDYGKRIRTVMSASHESDEITLTLAVSLPAEPHTYDQFSIGTVSPARANFGYVERR